MATPLPKPPFVAGFLWLTTAAILSSVAVSLAQPARGSVVGRAVDMSTAPMPGVSVTLLPERGGAATYTTTDRDGRYRFDDVPPDTYRIDFDLRGFDVARVNHLRVQPGATATADGVLRVGRLCDGRERARATIGQPLEGQVVDDAGRPLPYATLELVTAQGRETAYTGRDGRFLVRAPAEGAWSITAFDSGFEPVTRDVPANSGGSFVFTLRYAGTQEVPDRERLDRSFGCPADFFVHEP